MSLEDNINQRVIKLIDEVSKGNKSGFAKDIGVSPSTISSIIIPKDDGEYRSPNSEVILKIAEAFSYVDMNWLIKGEGDMIRKPILYKEDGNIFYLAEEEVRAGFLAGFNNISITKEQLQRVAIPGFESGELYMFPVKGDSMKPFITNGDMLITAEIRDLTQITSGNAYVFAHANEGIVVKRLYRTSKNLTFEARSDNQDYPPFEITFEQDSHIYIVKGVLTSNTSKR